ncbi:tat pathway signal sequence [Zalerion maritima]|uniref:Tat pathway signal sequence n=1 Tax=Zalerion maritima TaxID=339359 RepID=A0AAD5WNN9_9PEZI|nr:tat pathway signal sequence [Zalerion maritima]
MESLNRTLGRKPSSSSSSPHRYEPVSPTDDWDLEIGLRVHTNPPGSPSSSSLRAAPSAQSPNSRSNSSRRSPARRQQQQLQNHQRNGGRLPSRTSNSVSNAWAKRLREPIICTVPIVIATLFLLISATFFVFLGMVLGRFYPLNAKYRELKLDEECARRGSEYSPVLEDISLSYESTTFNGSFMHENRYRLDASPEVDEAWEELGVNYTLRQVLMCNVDTGVLGQVWVHPDHPSAFPDFETTHKCKNYNEVREWARLHQEPPTDELLPGYVEPPEVGGVYTDIP